ncbi:MAG: hypothetical protein SGILL_004444 [Bacillariaceae sp.]
MLPWRELGIADIETVAYKNGTVSLQDLERILQKHRQRKSIKIGSFSAASNVTGTVVDDLAITQILHQYGALSVWDYATGASYLEMNMNPTPSSATAKDAIFFSGHKLLGGIGTPGVLIVKKKLVSPLNPPENCGGGTVFYVTGDHHRFLSNRIERYEGGTPNVLGIWRLGLVWKFKLSLKASLDRLGASDTNGVGSTEMPPSLVACDFERAKFIQRRLKQIPNLVLLDGEAPEDVPKVPIFSFLIKCGTRFLHYNYVCAILNDLFGIQSRGGCQCAGPYSQLLLGMVDTYGHHSPSNAEVENLLVRTKDELLRPGATRLSLPTLGVTQEQQDYVVAAIQWVAVHGWKMMHVYRCNHRSGEWRHKSRPGAPLGTRDRLWLSHYQVLLNDRESPSINGPPTTPSFSRALSNADKMLELVLTDQSSITQALKMAEEDTISTLRWYVYPKDVARYVRDGVEEVPGTRILDNIQGAIVPLAWRKETTAFFGDDTPLEQESVTNDAEQDPAVLDNTRVLPQTYNFRDGNHSGAAPMEEIMEGFDDGELSDQCQIFHEGTDEWIDVTKFLQNSGVLRSSDAARGVDETFSNDLHDDDTNSDMALVGFDPDNELQLLDKKNNKKPARDSAAWGTGQMQPALVVETSRLRSPEDSQVKNVAHGSDYRTKKLAHVKPPPKLLRLVTQAMIQWDMLRDGDRLLLGLSGGKDSLSLLHILLHFQRKLPIRFEIEVCTIDPMTPPIASHPTTPQRSNSMHVAVERANSAGKDGKVVSSLCAFCARMKRGNLYACARANNCNKLVLAQHLDDLAESFMMSVMHNGFLRTMKANYNINAGDLAVIRPLAYCRESLMTEFARSANLPIINENCPACFEEPKERARMKKLLSKEEALYPNFYDNIKRAMLPLMHDDATAILRSYTEEALAKSRKEKNGKKHKGDAPTRPELSNDDSTPSPSVSLDAATDEDLVRELARRRAHRYKLAGAMAPRTQDGVIDPTGQVCSLNGGDGSIPCRELME